MRYSILTLLVAALAGHFSTGCRKPAEKDNEIVVEEKRHAPVARAGNDTTTYPPFNSYALDGRGSTDADKNITHYKWKQLSGPPAPPQMPLESWSPVMNLDHEGSYAYELEVTDADLQTSKDTIVITKGNGGCSGPDTEKLIEDLGWVWPPTVGAYPYIILDISKVLPAHSKLKKVSIQQKDGTNNWYPVSHNNTSTNYSLDYFHKSITIYNDSGTPQGDRANLKLTYCQ